MRTLSTILLTLVLAGCAQLTGGNKSTSSGGPPPGERNDVGKATTPNEYGRLDMPFLTSLSEADARATLEASQMKGNIKVDKTECYDKTIKSGHVCNTLPAGGEMTSTTSQIILFVVP
jgi:hypothetical protein